MIFDSPSSLTRTLKEILRWIYNNSAENIATHYLSFVEGATGKDERLNEDTNSSKVAVSAD